MSQSILIQNSLKFSAKIIKLQQYLTKQKKETSISKQIIRSATSIGANINEANYGSSKADFVAKMHISLKEHQSKINILRRKQNGLSGCCC